MKHVPRYHTTHTETVSAMLHPHTFVDKDFSVSDLNELFKDDFPHVRDLEVLKTRRSRKLTYACSVLRETLGKSIE